MKSLVQHLQESLQIDESKINKIPNSIGIKTSQIDSARKILKDSNHKIDLHEPIKATKTFSIFDLKTENNVILALTILQKHKIEVKDTDRNDIDSLM